MSDIPHIIATLLAALWWGGLVTIDLIETPSRFRTPNVSREAVLAIGNVIFRDFGRVQVALGTSLLIVLVVGGAKTVLPVLTILMLIPADINVFMLGPAMVKIRESVDGPLEPGSPEKARHARLHQAYMIFDLVNMVLGAALLAVLISA